MEEYKQEYSNLREQLETVMYNFGLVVEKTTEEDTEASCTALESINDSCRKLLAQIELYHAFVKLKINIREISQTIPKLYG
jgi:predicted amino acid-binding ACT domain protein